MTDSQPDALTGISACGCSAERDRVEIVERSPLPEPRIPPFDVAQGGPEALEGPNPGSYAGGLVRCSRTCSRLPATVTTPYFFS
jgi:hypothetical protein